MLNKSFKTNYFKVKNLSRSLKDPTTYHQIFLQNNYKEERLRHYIMPLNRNCIVSVYFTNKRCIYFELYDHSGQLIKLVQAVDNVSYFPILSNTSDKFIICYIAQPKAGSAREPFAMFVSHLRLYDADLNCLGETTERYLVESIFMDDKRIVSSFTRKSVDCCKAYDLSLNELESFGQQTNADEPFYFERLPVNPMDFKARLNPSIFGFNAARIYLHDRGSMLIMCRKTGRVIHSAHKRSESVKYMLDGQDNVIEVNITCKEVGFFHVGVGASARATYEIDANDVFLLEDCFLAFVNVKQQSVIIV